MNPAFSDLNSPKQGYRLTLMFLKWAQKMFFLRESLKEKTFEDYIIDLGFEHTAERDNGEANTAQYF